MACKKSNSNGDNILRQFCGSHLSNDVVVNAPMFSWATSQAICTGSINSSKAMHQQMNGSQGSFQAQSSLHTSKELAPTCTDQQEHLQYSSHEVKSRSAPLDDAEQLEGYVNELVPALHMVNKSTHNMHIAHRQEAIKCTADALLVRRATGMAWSDALSKRLSTFCTEATHHQGLDSLHLAKISTVVPDYMTPNVECASSSCIRTSVSSDGTNSCDFSDQEFSELHHESTASLASSDHSSMVDSTSELLQDDIDALTNVQSRVSLPLMDILSSSDARMGSVNSSGELLSLYKQGVNQLKSECQLHEEINARLAEIRRCYKEREMHEGRQHESCNGSIISSHSPKAYAFQCNICNDTSAGGKDYPFMKIPAHDRVEKKIIHEMHHDMPCQHADVAQFEQEYYNDLAAVCQNPRVDVQNGNAVFRQLGSYDTDVPQNVVHEMTADVTGGDITGLQGMQMHDKVALDDVVVHPVDGDAELEAKSEADVERGRHIQMPWQGSTSTTKDDVADEVANGGGEVGGLRCQQGLTWQDTMYLQSADDVAGDVGYAAEVDAGVVKRGSYGGNNIKMREMMYRMAAYQPINWDSIMEEVVGKEMPKRRNVRISKEPQSVAARRRRERISERIRILQRLVPGTSKLDTASMLDEAIHYLKFLKLQVQALRRIDKVLTCLPVFNIVTSQCPSSHIGPLPPFSYHSLPSSSVPRSNVVPLFQN